MTPKEEFLLAAMETDDKREILELALTVIDEQEETITETTQRVHLLEIILMILVGVLSIHAINFIYPEFF